MLKADGRVDQFSQNQASRFGLSVKEQGSGLVEQRLRERRLALDPLDPLGLLEITRQCHEPHLFLLFALGFTTPAFLRTLYSASRALA